MARAASPYAEAMRRITVEERRARLGARHGLVEPVGTVAEAVDAMVVLHATDPATVYLSAMARIAEPSLAAVSRALYDERNVVRLLGMRRTLFVAPVELVPVIERSSTDEVARRERKRLEKALGDGGILDPAGWLAEATGEIERALASGGLPARTLTTRAPILATRIMVQAGTKYATEVGATSRTLGLLAAEGRLMRGRPAGGWTGRQHEWHMRSNWLDAADGACVPGPVGGDDEWDEAAAATELVRRWLSRFGPGTFEDLKWWTGWGVGRLRRALAALDVLEVDLGDDATGLVLADDVDPVTPPTDGWVSLLPSLDPTPMGWKQRAWFLGPHQPRLFDRNGNIGPTVWVDGRIAGGWGQRPDGSVATELLEDVGRDHLGLIERELERLHSLISPTVVRPSFPTPLQRELSTGTEDVGELG